MVVLCIYLCLFFFISLCHFIMFCRVLLNIACLDGCFQDRRPVDSVLVSLLRNGPVDDFPDLADIASLVAEVLRY